MDDFSVPGVVNAFGVYPSEYNQIKPGKRPLSSMCPTIITDGNGDVILSLGGSGGTQITTATSLVILRKLLFDEDVKAAVDGIRLHHQFKPDLVKYEDEVPKSLLDDLAGLGHTVSPIVGRGSVIMAIERRDGQLMANSDFRKGGAVDGF